jgi:D-threo-aldose 1-dehydrogenase
VRSREVARTGVRLTELGFGAASLGNLYRATTDEQSYEAVRTAWERGIRYFDTAPHYGLGLSERRLGAALAGFPRDEAVISTKVGRLLVPNPTPTERDDDLFDVPGDLVRRWDFSRDGILRSVEASLGRLGTDHVDVVLLHDPDLSGIEGAAELGAKTLIELRDEGVVRAVGMGSNSSEAVAKLFDRADIDVAMLAGRYTLLEQRGADRLFEAAGERRVVAVGVFNSGLLAGPRPAPDATYDYEPAPAELIARANALADVAERHGVSLPQAAIAFPLRDSHVSSIAIGMHSAEQVVRNVELYEHPVPDALWNDLAAARLLDA